MSIPKHYAKDHEEHQDHIFCSFRHNFFLEEEFQVLDQIASLTGVHHQLSVVMANVSKSKEQMLKISKLDIYLKKKKHQEQFIDDA